MLLNDNYLLKTLNYNLLNNVQIVLVLMSYSSFGLSYNVAG